MRKVWISVFVMSFFLFGFFVFLGKNIGLSDELVKAIQCVLWAVGIISFIGALASGGRTDGDLIAGVEDEDGLVFALSTPVDKLVQKDIVTFKVVKEGHRYARR